jgi:hypothetical protein
LVAIIVAFSQLDIPDNLTFNLVVMNIMVQLVVHLVVVATIATMATMARKTLVVLY